MNIFNELLRHVGHEAGERRHALRLKRLIDEAPQVGMSRRIIVKQRQPRQRAAKRRERERGKRRRILESA